MRRRTPLLVSALLAMAMSVMPGLVLVVRAADTPDGAMNALLDVVVSKQFDQIGPLVCESRRDELTASYDLVSAFSSDGVDAQPLVDAMTLTLEGRDVRVVSEEGDAASVHVDGIIRIALDEDAARAWLRTSLEALGQPTDDASVQTFLDAIIGQLGELPAVSADVDVVREDGQWLVCDTLDADGPVESLDPGESGMASCDVITVDELNTLSELVFGSASLESGWCYYRPLDATNDLSSVIIRLQDGELDAPRQTFTDGSDVTVAGLPAWASPLATWVDIGDRLLVVQPLLMGGASAGVDPVAFAAAIAEIAIPRLPR